LAEAPSRLDLVFAALAERMPSTLRVARVAPARRAVVGAIVMVVAVVGVLGVRLAKA
jgi:hypothetical protein